MSETQPLVSIGMPLLNGEVLLREALDALLAQTHRNLEIIISDNASTDGTRAIYEEYAKRDSRIRFDRLPERVPAQINFNRLLEMAHGDYFMWAAFDDCWEPEFIERLLAELQRKQDAVLAFARWNNVDWRGNVVREFTQPWGEIDNCKCRTSTQRGSVAESGASGLPSSRIRQVPGEQRTQADFENRASIRTKHHCVLHLRSSRQ